MNPKVSVIMPVYNSQQFVAKSIKSALNQTYKNFELIIINDGSTDNSEQIIKSFDDNRIKYIKLKYSHGPAVARNRGLNVAKGAYIAFLDSDDIWFPSKLKSQLMFINDNNADLIYGYYDMVYENGQLKKHMEFLPKKITYHNLKFSNSILMSTCLVKSNIIYGYKFPSVHHEDYAFWLLLFRKRDIKARLFPYICVKYRIHHDSVSSNKFKSCVWVWNLYRKRECFNFMKALYCMVLWFIRGFIKHQNIL